MTQLAVLMDVLVIAVQAGFWVAVVFPVASALFWPWWKHAWGWTIVLLDWCIAMLLLGTVMEYEWGVKPAGAGVYVLLWCETVPLCLIPLTIVWRFILIFLTQRREVRHRADSRLLLHSCGRIAGGVPGVSCPDFRGLLPLPCCDPD